MANPEYFTLEEFRALPDCADFEEAPVLAAAAFFTAIVEREVGVPFIPRTYTATLDGTGATAVLLPHADIRSLTSVTVGGVAATVGDLSVVSGVLQYTSAGAGFGTTFPTGVANVVAIYSHGEFATCPADVKDAVMWATRDRLISQASDNGIDVRKTSMTNDLGGTIQYILPGEKRPTGYPELDALIASYVRHSAPLGFA